jgi:hypothetical protein
LETSAKAGEKEEERQQGKKKVCREGGREEE